MKNDYIICCHCIDGDCFKSEPGQTTYLRIPENATNFTPAHGVSMSAFYGDIINESQEDILIFIHGYNNAEESVLERHRALRAGFAEAGFHGDIITFAWPSGHQPLLYLEDRHDAKMTALQLVNDGIRFLARQQGKDCTINVHLLAHSTGAYIINEAFADAETTKETAEVNWTVSQILLISGDASADSMSAARAEAVYRHCNRLTNYYNPYDKMLAISNVKRVGAKNRVGRVGLPFDAPEKAVDINCGHYYDINRDILDVEMGDPSHSWYFYSKTWYEDATATLIGDLDRNVIPTRMSDAVGNLMLFDIADHEE